MSTYKQLVEYRLSADTAINRVFHYIQEVYDEDREAAQQFKTTSARDSVEGSVAMDLSEYARKVRERAKFHKDAEVANWKLNEIAKLVKVKRLELSLDAKGNREFLLALGRAEERVGLTSPQGNA